MHCSIPIGLFNNCYKCYLFYYFSWKSIKVTFKTIGDQAIEKTLRVNNNHLWIHTYWMSNHLFYIKIFITRVPLDPNNFKICLAYGTYKKTYEFYRTSQGLYIWWITTNNLDVLEFLWWILNCFFNSLTKNLINSSIDLLLALASWLYLPIL